MISVTLCEATTVREQRRRRGTAHVWFDHPRGRDRPRHGVPGAELVCSALAEAWAHLRATRSKNLREAVARLLGENPKDATNEKVAAQKAPLTTAFYADPRIVALKGKKIGTGTDRDPSYVHRRTFSDVAIDVIAGLAPDDHPGAHALRAKLERARAEAPNVAAPATTMLGFLDDVLGDREKFTERVATWFDDTMERASGWYRRRTRIVLLVAGLLLAAFANADSFRIVRVAQQNPAVREALVAQGAALGQSGDADELRSDLQAVRDEAAKLESVLGWTREDWNASFAVLGLDVDSDEPSKIAESEDDADDDGRGTVGALLSKLIGILVTGIALSLGAPFWFNALQWLLSIRNSVRPEDVDAARTKATSDGSKKPTNDMRPSAGVSGATAARDAMLDRLALPDTLRTGALGFRPLETDDDLLNDWWMARLSLLAYSDADAVHDTLRGWSLVGETHPLRVSDAIDTQALIAEGESFAAVAFRGTEPRQPDDIITDLKFALEAASYLDPAKIHRGFRDALEPFWEDHLLPILETLPERPRALWFTGHSLGGALALLAAARTMRWRFEQLEGREGRIGLEAELADREGKAGSNAADDPEVIRLRRHVANLRASGIIGVRTFGQPRVGDDAFGAAVRELIGERATRYVNHRDVVPRLPPRRFGYDHVGTVAMFDGFGGLVREPSAWRRFLDLVLVSPDDVRGVPLESGEGSLDAGVPGCDRGGAACGGDRAAAAVGVPTTRCVVGYRSIVTVRTAGPLSCS